MLNQNTIFYSAKIFRKILPKYISGYLLCDLNIWCLLLFKFFARKNIFLCLYAESFFFFFSKLIKLSLFSPFFAFGPHHTQWGSGATPGSGLMNGPGRIRGPYGMPVTKPGSIPDHLHARQTPCCCAIAPAPNKALFYNTFFICFGLGAVPGDAQAILLFSIHG